jgi:hypothetical protein
VVIDWFLLLLHLLSNILHGCFVSPSVHTMLIIRFAVVDDVEYEILQVLSITTKNDDDDRQPRNNTPFE